MVVHRGTDLTSGMLATLTVLMAVILLWAPIYLTFPIMLGGKMLLSVRLVLVDLHFHSLSPFGMSMALLVATSCWITLFMVWEAMTLLSAALSSSGITVLWWVLPRTYISHWYSKILLGTGGASPTLAGVAEGPSGGARER